MRILTIVLALALLLRAPLASANGRFPEANQISFSSNEPDLVLVRVTFGLLVSRDRGKTWEWICETGIGFSGVEDPMYAPTSPGTLIGTTFQGLTITRDRGCNFDFAGGELEKQVFIDLTSNPKDSKNVFVFASNYDRQDDAGTALFRSRIWETTNEGESFTQVGGELDPSLLGYTIDVTETDPNRLYVTAIREPGATVPRAFLMTSTDRGLSFRDLQIPLQGTERAIFIAAVDPTNADRVYLRTYAGLDQPTRLLVVDGASDAGAQTVRTLFQGQGPLAAFALTPDGSRIWVGGPKDGIHIASTSDFTFAKKSSLEALCLAVGTDGLWACSNERSGFVAALSKDDGATFETKLHFCDIRATPACGPTDKTTEQCAASVAPLRTQLGCDVEAGVRDGGADGGADISSEDEGGCGCRATPSSMAGPAVTALGILALGLFRRRLRRK